MFYVKILLQSLVRPVHKSTSQCLKKDASRSMNTMFLDLSSTNLSLSQIEQERWIDIGKMSALMVHEIKTALSSAMLYTEHLAQGAQDIEKQQQRLEKLQRSHQQIAHQLQTLSSFIQGHHHCLKPQQVILDHWCQVLQERVHSSIDAEEIKFMCHNNVSRQSVCIHAESLLSAVLNLVVNAWQAKASCIRIDINQHESQSWQLKVTDDGIGMSEDVYAQALLPFFTTKPKGNGLGLVVVNAVIQAHGGSIRLDSSIGVGSCFIITLPMK